MKLFDDIEMMIYSEWFSLKDSECLDCYIPCRICHYHIRFNMLGLALDCLYEHKL